MYYIYSQNTTILVRSGTVCIDRFQPLYWPLSGFFSTLISNHTIFAVYSGGRDLVYNSLVVYSQFLQCRIDRISCYKVLNSDGQFVIQGRIEVCYTLLWPCLQCDVGFFLHLNTTERSYIHAEYTTNNHLNDSHTTFPNVIFETLLKTSGP